MNKAKSLKQTTIVAAILGLVSLGLSTCMASWTYAPWTGDADSGITSAATYTVAVNLGGSAVTVNGVACQASALSGANFSIGGALSTYNGGTPNITGNSLTLASDFIYHGQPRTVTLRDLTPGATFETTFFS